MFPSCSFVHSVVWIPQILKNNGIFGYYLPTNTTVKQLKEINDILF